MATVASALLKQMYAFTLNLLRKYTIEHIEEGDVALDQLRTQITTEFEKLKASIQVLRLVPLRAAQQNLADAMIYVESDRLDHAQRHFEHAQQNAINAFAAAVNFDGKVLATKIRLLSLFYLEGYFTSSTPNITALEALCRQALMPLFESAEVQSAIAHHSGGLFGFGKKEGRRVLAEVSALRHTVAMRLSPGMKFPLLSNTGDELMTSAVVVNEISCNAECFAISEDKLFGGTKDGSIRVWDFTTLIELPALKRHLGTINCLLVSERRMFSASSSIKVWDLNCLNVVACLRGHARRVNCIALAGNKLYSGGWDGTIRVWDLVEWSELLSVRCLSLLGDLSVSSNKLYSTCLNQSYVSVWDSESLQLNDLKLEGFPTSGSHHCIIVSGNRLYSGCEYNGIKVWELINHTEIAHLRGQSVRCLLVFCGKLYSGGYDGTIHVWELHNFTKIACIVAATNGLVRNLHIYADKMYVAVPNKIVVRLFEHA